MYTDFYCLKEKPFDLSPSPRYLYLGDIHKEALALLTYGVVERKGFILLTGEVGTGKTTMVHALLESLDSNDQYVYLSNPLFSPEEFRDYLGFSVFKQKANFKSKAEFLILFEGYLKEQLRHRKSILLIIDEAQKLSIELLEEIRLLSNMETSEGKLINIFLVGQPELNETLSRPECRPLLQRISIRYQIKPLDSNETREYIKRRMLLAGAEKWKSILPNSTIKAIYRFSDGYPRMINILADNALMLGYSREKKKISPDMIRECYDDLQLEGSFFQVKTEEEKDGSLAMNKPRFSARKLSWLAVSTLVLLVIVSVFTFFFESQPLNKAIKSTLLLFASQNPLTDNLPVAQKIGAINNLAVDSPEKSSAGKNIPALETKELPLDNVIDISTVSQVNNTSVDIVQSNSNTEDMDSMPGIKRALTKNNPIAGEDQELNETATELFGNHTKIEKVTTTNDAVTGGAQFDSSIKETGDTTAGFKRPLIRKTLIVVEGQTLNELTTEVYGYTNDYILNYVQKYNPGIKDINLIEIGRKIMFPELKDFPYQEAYTVHIASFSPMEEARQLFNELVGKGYEAYIIPVVNSQKGKMFRVTLGYFKNRQEATELASELLKKGIADYAEPITFNVK